MDTTPAAYAIIYSTINIIIYLTLLGVSLYLSLIMRNIFPDEIKSIFAIAICYLCMAFTIISYAFENILDRNFLYYPEPPPGSPIWLQAIKFILPLASILFTSWAFLSLYFKDDDTDSYRNICDSQSEESNG